MARPGCDCGAARNRPPRRAAVVSLGGQRSCRRHRAVELGRIELPSARRSLDLLRPFPCPWLYGCHTAGSVEPKLTAGSFPDASGLSHRQRSLPAVHRYFCCRAVAIWPRAALLLTMSLLTRKNQAARAKSLLALLLVALFNESEQLGSHEQASGPNVETLQPLQGCPSFFSDPGIVPPACDTPAGFRPVEGSEL